MGKVPEVLNIGNREEITTERLLVLLERAYYDLANAINKKPDLYQRDVDGQVDDTMLAQGSININLLTDKVEILSNHTSQTTVTWVTLS